MQAIWKLIAWVLTRPTVTAWLIRRAQRTPYTHITSASGDDIYMGRWWLFNPYGRDADGEQSPARWPWLPSVRIHHIRRPDQDRDLHDHPWNARTIVLRGWYEEERYSKNFQYPHQRERASDFWQKLMTRHEIRTRGYTGRLLFGQYHRISAVSDDGVWTLFITGRKRGTWGFDVNGKKVPWRTYLGLDKPATPNDQPEKGPT